MFCIPGVEPYDSLFIPPIAFFTAILLNIGAAREEMGSVRLTEGR
ncbi:Uncharacterised protein [uncultured archaeon]|nr:Uncharacterised protein [uncultured archaeon]